MTFLTGALATAAVLMGGLVAFKKGNKQLSQTMMRARILAQGGTVAIMLATSGKELSLMGGNFSSQYCIFGSIAAGTSTHFSFFLTQVSWRRPLHMKLQMPNKIHDTTSKMYFFIVWLLRPPCTISSIVLAFSFQLPD